MTGKDKNKQNTRQLPVALTCKEIQQQHLLVDYITDHQTIDPQRLSALQTHLDTCPQCREEVLLMQQLQQEAETREAETDALMATIDWDQTAETITANIPFKTPAASPNLRKPGLFTGLLFNWKMAAAAMTLVFGIGIGLGYLLFHQPQRNPLPLMANETSTLRDSSDASLARLETTLAKREVRRYFQQSQLVLTDLMGKCDSESSFSWKNQMDMKRVRTLLNKNRYFNQSLNNPDLLGSKELLKKIEWLLYEIIINNQDNSCQKLEKLQEYIKQEKLLFKIRLVGKELSTSEV